MKLSGNLQKMTCVFCSQVSKRGEDPNEVEAINTPGGFLFSMWVVAKCDSCKFLFWLHRRSSFCDVPIRLRKNSRFYLKGKVAKFYSNIEF